ncbi:hypothetical protein ACE40V_24005, partial [Salmonella enterica]|uniref:hypothetical protein n=1 Tax=Salmonella enterica TaxID=28901 RepID=UPI003D26903B
MQTQETQVEYLKPNDKEQLSSESIVVEEVERFNDPIMNSSSVPSVVYSDVNPSKIDPVTASSTESQT